MDWHTGAGSFSLLILCFVISWAPSQETPVPAPSDLEAKICELKYVAKKVYESYENLENSLQNVTDSLVPYGPELNLSAIWAHKNMFLNKLKKIKKLEMDLSSKLQGNIMELILQLDNLQPGLVDTDPTSSPPLAISTWDAFRKKRFALNTFKQFSHFMTYLFEYRHRFTAGSLLKPVSDRC